MRKRFEALELSITIIPHLRKLLPAIRRHDAKLHKQLSADEVHTGLRIAVGWGYFPGSRRMKR